MYNTRFSSNYFKLFCLSLIVSFLAQQVAFAAPVLDVSGFISRPSGVYSLHIPESIALIDDEYIAGPGASTVYLLQDAHTNASGQFNMAKIIDFLIREKNADLVFTEAADGEISLSDLKTQVSPDVMKFEATALVRKGYLHASEFLALTGSRDFRLIGVEDRALYDEGLLIYRQIMSERTEALAYLKKLNRTAKVLKGQIYSADLMRLDDLKSDYLKDKLSVTDYVIGLSGLAGADSIRFKSITDLSKLKQMEDAIDFEEASRAQSEILMRLTDEDQDVLHDMLKSSAKKVGLREDKARTGFYALLKEKAAVILNEYPEFEKYLRYVDESKKLNIPQVLEDLEKYENAVAVKLAATQDQRTLLTLSENLRLLENLWSMQIDPADFSRYQQNKTSYSTKIISGFFNKKIMDLEGYFEHAAELDESFDQSTEKIERFYNLTYQRDKTFIRRLIQTVNSESKKSSVLIAGGYHSPNLKALLKENGYSYVSITPQVIHETNYMRYESLLLSQIRNTDIESGTLSSDADKWMTLDISAPSTKISSPIFSRAQLNDLLISGRTQPQASPAVAASRLALFGDKGVQSDEDKQHLLKQISNPRTSVHKLESLRKTLTDLSEPTSDAVLQRFRQPVSDAKTWGNKFGLTSHDKQVELSKKVAQNQKEVLDALHSRWQVLRSAADRDILLGRIFESEITLDELISLHRDLTEPDSTTEDEVVKRFREFELTDEHVVSRGEVFSGLNELLAESTAMLEELLTDKYTFFQDTDLAETVLAHLDTIKKFLSEIRSYEESIYKIEEVEIYRWSDAVKRKHQDLVAKSSKTKRSVDKILGSILELLPDDSYQNLFQIDPSKGTSQMLPFVIALRHLTLHRKQGTSPVALPELGVRRPASKQAVGRGEINRLPTMITDAETAFVEYFAGDFDIDEAVEKYHKALSINTRWAEGALEADFLQHSHEIEQGFLFTDIEWMIKTFDPDGQLDESARADLRVKYAEAQKRVRQLFNEKLLNPLTAKYKDFPHITEIDRLGAVLYPLVSKEGALQSLSNEKIEWFIRDLKSNAGHGRDIPEPEYENDQIKNSLQIEAALRHLYFELHVLRELRIFTSGVVPTENPWSQRGIQGARLSVLAPDVPDFVKREIVGLIKELSDKGIHPKIHGNPLINYTDNPDILIDRIRQLSVLKDADDIRRVLSWRLQAEGRKPLSNIERDQMIDIFDSIFDPEAYLNSPERKKRPVKISLFRRGRSGSQLTNLLKILPNVELSIILSATDDGESWFEASRAFRATGVPGAGKAIVDLATDRRASDFLSYRIDGSADERVLIRDFKHLISRLEKPDNFKQPVSGSFEQIYWEAMRIAEENTRIELVSYLRAFVEELDRYNRLNPDKSISIRNLPIRSLVLLGAKLRIDSIERVPGDKQRGEWQRAVNRVARLLKVPSKHQILLPTQERQHVIALRADGTLQLSEVSINEYQSDSEILAMWLINEPVDRTYIQNLISEIGVKAEFAHVEAEEVETPEFLEQVRGTTLFLDPKSLNKAVEYLDSIASNTGKGNKTVAAVKEVTDNIKKADIILYTDAYLETNVGGTLLVPGIGDAIRGKQDTFKKDKNGSVTKNRVEAKGVKIHAGEISAGSFTGDSVLNRVNRLNRYARSSQAGNEDQTGQVADYAFIGVPGGFDFGQAKDAAIVVDEQTGHQVTLSTFTSEGANEYGYYYSRTLHDSIIAAHGLRQAGYSITPEGGLSQTSLKENGSVERERLNEGLFKQRQEVRNLIDEIIENWDSIIEKGAFVFDVDMTILPKDSDIFTEYPEFAYVFTRLLRSNVKLAIISGNSYEEQVKRILHAIEKEMKGDKSSLRNLTFYLNGGSTKVYIDQDGNEHQDTAYNEKHAMKVSDLEKAINAALKDLANRPGGSEIFGLTPDELKAMRKKFELDRNENKVKNVRIPDQNGLEQWDVLWEVPFTLKDAQEIGSDSDELIYPWVEKRGEFTSQEAGRKNEKVVASVTIKPLPKFEIDGRSIDLRDELQELIRNYLGDDAYRYSIRSGGSTSTDITLTSAGKVTAIEDFIYSNNRDPKWVFYSGDEFYYKAKTKQLGNDEVIAIASKEDREGIRDKSGRDPQVDLSEVRTLAFNAKDMPGAVGNTVWVGRTPQATFEFLEQIILPERFAGARLASEANDTAEDLFAVVAGNVVEGYLPQNAEERRLLRLFAAKVKNDNRYAVLWDSGHLSVVDVQDRGGKVEIRIQNQLIETVDLNRINREYTLANSEERLAADRVADALLAAEEIKAAITEGSESVQLLTENRRNNFNYGFKIPVSRLFDLDSIRDAQERESASQFLLSIMKWAAGSDWGGVGRIIFHISEEELNALPEDLKKFWSRAVETYPFITSTPIVTASSDYVAVAWITDENESVENAVNIKMPKLRRGEMPLNFSNGITMAIEVFLTVVPDSKETAGEAKRYFSRATSGLGELLTDINHKLTAPFTSEAAALEAFQQGRYGLRQTLKAGLVKVGEYLRTLRLVRATVRISA